MVNLTPKAKIHQHDPRAAIRRLTYFESLVEVVDWCSMIYYVKVTVNLKHLCFFL